MDIIILITGLFMVAMGFLVKAFPNLIAGYNTMPKDKKKNVDIDGLSTYIRNGFITIGLSIIVGYYLFEWTGFTMIADSMILIVTLVGVTLLVINAQRFDHNKSRTNKTKFTYFILGLVVIFIFGLIAYGYIPSKVFFDNGNIKFSGMYGFEMNVSEIDNVELSDTIPAILLRTNGFSFGTVNKGCFNLDKFGKTRLLIHSHNTPFLIISKSNTDRIIINFRDKTKTEQIFEEIKGLINK